MNIPLQQGLIQRQLGHLRRQQLLRSALSQRSHHADASAAFLSIFYLLLGLSPNRIAGDPQFVVLCFVPYSAPCLGLLLFDQ